MIPKKIEKENKQLAKTREDFKPDVGTFLNNVDGDITDAEFAIATGDYADKVMMGGEGAEPPVVIKLTIESPELERPATQTYSVGSQALWEILDGGKAIQNVKKPDSHLFRKGSRAWALANAMITAVGEGKVEKGQDFFIKRDAYMTEAKFYTGTSWHWATQPLNIVGGGTSDTPLPEKFLGEVKPVKGKVVATTVEADDDETEALDLIITEIASGKTERELKSFAVRYPDIKKNDAYLKSIYSGKRIKVLEDAGKLTKDPETQRFI